MCINKYIWLIVAIVFFSLEIKDLSCIDHECMRCYCSGNILIRLIVLWLEGSLTWNLTPASLAIKLYYNKHNLKQANIVHTVLHRFPHNQCRTLTTSHLSIVATSCTMCFKVIIVKKSGRWSRCLQNWLLVICCFKLLIVIACYSKLCQFILNFWQLMQALILSL